MKSKKPTSQLHDHRRQWHQCLYVYPVIARRSDGLSIGVNINPDKRCNFSCVYCQVDRHSPRGLSEVNLAVLRDELTMLLSQAKDGQLWNDDRFATTPTPLRRINDIAFSGDGEPTCVANFDQAVAAAAHVKHDMGLGHVKLVIITNATNLDSPQFKRALPILDANNGEIWAKLDAGTEEYFRKVDRPAPSLTLGRIVDSIAAIAQDRPVVIQTLFMNLQGLPPSHDEITAYTDRLNRILLNGGRIKLVQIHTIARRPAEQYAQPLSNEQLDTIAQKVRSACGVTVQTYGSAMP